MIAVLGFGLTGCGDPPPARMELEPEDNGIRSTPKWLTFTCVEPGCATTLTSTIVVVGDRDVAITRIVLSDRDRDDFEVRPKSSPPFILKTGEVLPIEVDYNPTGDPRLGDIDLRIAFTDASASEEQEGKIPPGELLVPLVRRQVGEPLLSVTPNQLIFGAVLPSARKSLPLTLSNTGFGNVGLLLKSIEVDPPGELRVENQPTNGILPGELWDLEVIYQPTQEAFLEGLITLKPISESTFPTLVPLMGTSISRPYAYLTPNNGLDFGEVNVGDLSMVTLQITNRGAENLVVHNVTLGGQVPGAQLEMMGSMTSTIAPLESEEINLALLAELAGAIETNLRITSNDPENPVLDVPVTGLMTKPTISVEPGLLDYGTVPQGWTIPQALEIRNSGFGELRITGVSMILGSSELFTITDVPSLPVVLRHDERIGIPIEFRAEAEAVFNGTLSIDSNDPDTPFVEIPLTASGASCETGCPIANGLPSCTSGNCEIASCNDQWYDADVDPANGCECREVDTNGDASGFCQGSVFLGTLDDDGDSATYTGILPEDGDEDVIRFFGKDKTDFLSEDFDVRISMQSTDPDISFCVYRHETGDHTSECFFENERCPANRSYRRDGRLGPSDDADFIIKVFREPSAAPTCTSYTLFMRNG